MSGSASNKIFTAGAPVNVNVQRIEDEFQKSLNLSGFSLDPGELPQRPAYGETGYPSVVATNYVEMRLNPDQDLFQYSIVVTPEATGRKLHRVIEILLKELPMKLDLFTNYKSILIVRNAELDCKAFSVRFYSEDENGPSGNSTVYQVEIEKTKTFKVGMLRKHIDPKNGFAYDDHESMLQALNIMLYQHSKSNPDHASVGNKTFPLSGTAKQVQDLRGGLQALRGFFASTRLGTGRVLVNVGVTYGVFYEPGSLNNLIKAFGYRDKHKLERFLKYLRVQKTHLKKKENTIGAPTRTIWGLATPEDGRTGPKNEILPNPPKVLTFGAGSKDVKFYNTDVGEHMSVYDYFQKVLGLTLKNAELPVVNLGSAQKPVYLPPEFCHVPPGQHATMRRVTLDSKQTTIMLKMAVKTPAQNFELIMNHGLTVTGLRGSRFIDPNYSRVIPQLLTVNARVRKAPTIACATNVSVRPDASWNLANHRYNQPGQLKSWRWLWLTISGCKPEIQPSSGQKSMQSFADSFKKALALTGIRIGNCQTGMRFNLKSENDSTLEQILRDASKGVELVWIIVPKSIKLLYDRIKLTADVKLGVATVLSRDVKLAESSQAQLNQYLGNEALKVNLKLGGRNQVVEPRRTYFIQDNCTMIVGIDVTHPSTDLTRGGAPSVAAMVASVDRHLATWFAEISIQQRRQERVSDLDKMLKTRLEIWRARHGSYPLRILVYRDGVAEGQYQMVKTEEQPLLEKACKELYGALNQSLPETSIVIVAKRHHTRFAPTTLNGPTGADRKFNCPAGTVVDRGITSPTLWQFFLQPHSAIQGSARPGFYTVIVDEIFRNAARNPSFGGVNAADICEDVTQSLCYTFGRATRAVGIVTPAYYADLVCDRATCYLNAIAASSLAEGSSQKHGGPAEISENRRNQLQSMIDTHMKLKETMFFI